MTLDELKSALADRIEPLALELLQAAPTTRARDEIRFGRKGALAVRVAGPKRGTFCDYSGSAKGDALSLIQYARQCEPREAFRWARAWLGAAPGSHAPPLPPKPPTPTASPPESGTADLARRLWGEALPARGTLAERYLASRGLALEDAAPIRFHPRAWRNRSYGAPGPSMVALMTCAETGEPVGLHVTYLRPDGSAKAEGERVKVMLGKAGVIRLAPIEGPALGIAEGMRARIAEHAAEIVQAQLDRAIDPAHPQGHAAAVDLLNRIMPPETRQTLAGDPTAPILRIERVILEAPPREK